MKLTRIIVKDFRGFSNEETVDLAVGKNLLLYGENGSGKTSLFRALVEFFNRSPHAKPFHDFRNLFLSSPTLSAIDGRIDLEMSDGTHYEWRCLGTRPWNDRKVPQPDRDWLTDASRRAALLDYRSLLRTSFGASNLKERLFDLAVTTLLTNVSVPVSGGRERTIGELWRSLQNFVPGFRERHTSRRLSSLADAEKVFNSALSGKLPEVQLKTSEILGYFEDSFLEVELGFTGVNYKQFQKEFEGKALEFAVKLHGVAVAEWNDQLNEARLTALALSLYLAGVELANTTPPLQARTPLRILALDDILIGLDLAHRLPLLRIIQDRMADFQVILLTHDRVWFDLAQQYVSDSDDWVFYEMYRDEVRGAQTVFDVPVLKPQAGNAAEHFINLANRYLNGNDYRAAALYARASFEVKLKTYCSNRKVQVAYDADGRHLNTDHFLDAIQRRLLWNGTRSLCIFNLQRVRLFREGVLNPSAHFHPVSLARTEIESAIRAVQSLKFPDEKCDFAKKVDELLRKPAALKPEEMIDASCYLRTAFEADLRDMLSRIGGTVKFRDDWTKIDLAELWDSAKAKMNEVNAVLAGPLIADVDGNAAYFLNDWTFANVSAFTKGDLDTAWKSLCDSTVAAPRTRLATFV